VTVILYETEATWSSKAVGEVTGGERRRDLLCVPVQAHDDPLYSSALFGTGTFGKQFIYLLLGGVEAEISNLFGRMSSLRIGKTRQIICHSRIA
jgi:hypothetical protein